jgi:hypothetical protein
MWVVKSYRPRRGRGRWKETSKLCPHKIRAIQQPVAALSCRLGRKNPILQIVSTIVYSIIHLFIQNSSFLAREMVYI